MFSRITRGFIAAVSGAVLSAVVMTAIPAATVGLSASAAVAQDGEAQLDTLIMKNGQQIQGRIVEEKDGKVWIIISTAGITAGTPTSYDLDDILTIERGAGDGVAGESKPAEDAHKPWEKKDPLDAIPDDKTTIYMVEFKGEFGKDVSRTPMHEVMRDVKKYQPDILLVKINNSFSVEKEEMSALLGFSYFDEFENAAALEPLFTDEIENDDEWVKKPRLVFWIKRAMGGPAFLPFISPDIFYTSDARHGGIGYLDLVFAGYGDPVVQEKQRSLRLARAEGMVIQGGHPVEIIRAMSRSDYVLSYTMIEGKPKFYERSERGEHLLTDNGRGDNMDNFEDSVMGKGNDILTLTADEALKLGISKGTADSIDQILFHLGLSRDYYLIENKSDRVFQSWKQDVIGAQKSIARLWRDFGKAMQDLDQAEDYRERTQARGRGIRKLKEIKSLVDRYKESISREFFYAHGIASAENMDIDINLRIERLKIQQRLDSPDY